MAHAIEEHPVVIGDAPAGRRFGYAVSIVVNLGLLYVTRHLLDWGWPAFLTEQFRDLLPIITLSFVASIVANMAFLFYDASWFKSLANAITAAIAFFVAVRTLQVFPFDFSGYDYDWSGVFRIALYLGILGTAIAFVVELTRVIMWPARSHPDEA